VKCARKRPFRSLKCTLYHANTKEQKIRTRVRDHNSLFAGTVAAAGKRIFEKLKANVNV